MPAKLDTKEFIRRSKEKFGNWTMAVASYNMGMHGLASVAKKQKENNYYDLFLNTETSRYVFRLLAFKIILEKLDGYCVSGFFDVCRSLDEMSNNEEI